MRVTKNQRGVAIVETALTLLPFFVFLFAIVEAGWFFYVQSTITNAAREGAKMAAKPLTQTDTLQSQDEIRTYLAGYLSTIGVNCPTCITLTRDTVVECPSPTCTPAHNVIRSRVRVQITYSPLTLSMFGTLAFPMHGEALMRTETSSY